MEGKGIPPSLLFFQEHYVSTFEARTLANLKREMNRLQVNNSGHLDTFWPCEGRYNMQDAIFFKSEDQIHRRIVRIVTAIDLSKYVVDFVAYADLTASVRFRAKPIDLHIKQGYAPISDLEDHEVRQ